MCFSSSKRDEEEIVVPVRLVKPTIIKTAPTFPISANNGDAIVLTQRSPRTSQRSYRIEQRTSSSRSPRTSDRQIVLVESARSSQLPLSLTQSGLGLSRPSVGPLQGSSSPRTSTGRVHFVDREPSRLAASMLNPAPDRVIPHHRRSASQVIVINRSSSQRLGPVTPRISDSLLVNSSGATYAVSRTIAPSPPIRREPRIVDIEPRASRLSQVSTGYVEIETAGKRRSRRHSNVQAICTDGDPRGSGTWRPVREKYVVVDSKGNKTEYYR